jgi:hypothetical protein
MFKHTLGVEVESRVAKIKGIITSRSENLYGCNRYFVQPPAGKDGKYADGYWTDEDDLIVKGKGVTTPKKNTGGPMSRVC